jgi:hypothetical protein
MLNGIGRDNDFGVSQANAAEDLVTFSFYIGYGGTGQGPNSSAFVNCVVDGVADHRRSTELKRRKEEEDSNAQRQRCLDRDSTAVSSCMLVVTLSKLHRKTQLHIN